MVEVLSVIMSNNYGLPSKASHCHFARSFSVELHRSSYQRASFGEIEVDDFPNSFKRRVAPE